MRIKDMITQSELYWCFNNFSPVVFYKKSMGTRKENLFFDIRNYFYGIKPSVEPPTLWSKVWNAPFTHLHMDKNKKRMNFTDLLFLIKFIVLLSSILLRDNKEARSRALDNLGRLYAKRGEYTKAIDSWMEKLPLSKSALESTWLYHEIGRCHLELKYYQDAKEFGQKSLAAAEQADDKVWQLNATVLEAQAEGEFCEKETWYRIDFNILIFGVFWKH